MSSVDCLIQAGGPAASMTADLEQGLIEAHDAHSPGDELSVSWQEVPRGFMFTEGQPSTTSVVAFRLDRPTTLAEREVLLRATCDLFVDVTGCTVGEVLAAVTPNPEDD